VRVSKVETAEPEGRPGTLTGWVYGSLVKTGQVRSASECGCGVVSDVSYSRRRLSALGRDAAQHSLAVRPRELKRNHGGHVRFGECNIFK
jgi:hypothetical protein